MHNPRSAPPTPDPRLAVVLAEPIADEPRRWLDARVVLIESPAGNRQRLLEHLAQAHALIVRTYTIVDQELLDHAPNLRVIARAGVGLDNIDLDACKARSIPVVHTPHANTSAVVEYVLTMMLRTRRPICPIAPSDRPIDNAHWHALRQSAITPRTCIGARLGVIGFGQIGSALGRVAQALGMEVVYHDLRDIPKSDRHGCTPASLPELAKTSDVISVHVDGRPGNHHLLNGPFFDQLKDDVIMLNTSRGFVLDTLAAARFARAHPDATLILDVHDPEPIAPDSPLYTIDNVICTPHIAAGTQSAKEQMSWVVRDVLRVLTGRAPEFSAS